MILMCSVSRFKDRGQCTVASGFSSFLPRAQERDSLAPLTLGAACQTERRKFVCSEVYALQSAWHATDLGQLSMR